MQNFEASGRIVETNGKGFRAGGRNMKFNMLVHDNGVIHFISDCGSYITKGSPYFEPYIMSYNLKNGTSTMLKLSKTARKSSTDEKCDMSIFECQWQVPPFAW
ncbi:hypothetical protein ACSQ67_011720 [Phaseolus vulgaris]